MIFVIASANLQDAVTSTTSGGTVYNESMTLSHFPNETTAGDDSRFNSMSIVTLVNATIADDGELISINAANYTISGATINLTTISSYDQIGVNVTYTWTYITTTEAIQVINDTSASIAESIDWFSTFVVLAALVVLILLVVIIINSIRASGITSGA